MGNAPTIGSSWRIAPLLALALPVAFLFAANSAQAGVKTSAHGPIYYVVNAPTTAQVENDSGFLYWIQTDRGGQSNKPTETLMQRSILTGVTRELFTPVHGDFGQFSAGAGRIAFTNLIRSGKPPAVKLRSALYTMSAVDAKPTKLDQALGSERILKQIVQHKGKRRKVSFRWQCGESLYLNDVSESGQILSTISGLPCGKTGDYTLRQSLYAPNATKAVPLDTSRDEYALRISNNILLLSQNGQLLSRSLNSAASFTLMSNGGLISSAISADGHIAIAVLVFDLKSRKFNSTMNIYAPDSGKLLSATPISSKHDTDLAFCADSVLQVTIAAHGPSKLTLRNYDGSVITQVDGPPSRHYASASCTGRHAVVTSKTKSGPAMSEYDL